MMTTTQKKTPTRFQVCRVLEKAVMAADSQTTFLQFKAEPEAEQISYLRWLYRQAPMTAMFYPQPENLRR